VSEYRTPPDKLMALAKRPGEAALFFPATTSLADRRILASLVN